MSDLQDSEQYEPGSTAGIPEHGRERLERMRDRSFFTSDLSVNEFLLVKAAGFDPLGLVMGTCVYHVAHQGLGGWFKRIGRNTEMPNFTQALYDARELAMERMQSEAEALDAEGIVGVQLNEGSHGWDSHVIEYFAVGTAVTPISEDHSIPPPSFVLTLNDESTNRLTGF